MDKEVLVAIHKNHHGEIISFQTSDGRIISYRKALLEASNGTLSGVNIFEKADGNSTLVSVDGSGLQYLPDIY